jgi:hypothetical protein
MTGYLIKGLGYRPLRYRSYPPLQYHPTRDMNAEIAPDITLKPDGRFEPLALAIRFGTESWPNGSSFANLAAATRTARATADFAPILPRGRWQDRHWSKPRGLANIGLAHSARGHASPSLIAPGRAQEDCVCAHDRAVPDHQGLPDPAQDL